LPATTSCNLQEAEARRERGGAKSGMPPRGVPFPRQVEGPFCSRKRVHAGVNSNAPALPSVGLLFPPTVCNGCPSLLLQPALMYPSPNFVIIPALWRFDASFSHLTILPSFAPTGTCFFVCVCVRLSAPSRTGRRRTPHELASNEARGTPTTRIDWTRRTAVSCPWPCQSQPRRQGPPSCLPPLARGRRSGALGTTHPWPRP